MDSKKWEYSHIRKAGKAVNYVPVVNWVVGEQTILQKKPSNFYLMGIL